MIINNSNNLSPVSFVVDSDGNWCIIVWIQHGHLLYLYMLMCLYGAKALLIYRLQINHCSAPTPWTVKNGITPKPICILLVRKLFHAYSSLRCGRYVYMQLEKQLVKVSGLMFTVMMVIVVDRCTDIIGKTPLGNLSARGLWARILLSAWC